MIFQNIENSKARGVFEIPGACRTQLCCPSATGCVHMTQQTCPNTHPHALPCMLMKCMSKAQHFIVHLMPANVRLPHAKPCHNMRQHAIPDTRAHTHTHTHTHSQSAHTRKHNHTHTHKHTHTHIHTHNGMSQKQLWQVRPHCCC